MVWSAALLAALVLGLLDMPFSVRRVAIPYALFLARIAAIVVLIVGAHRLGLRLLRRAPGRPLGASDVVSFLRTLAFYLVALTTYTNLKTRTLLLHPRVFDGLLEKLDRWMFLGVSPTELTLALGDRPGLTGLLDDAYAYAWVPLAITFGIVLSQAGGEGFRRLARVIPLNYLLAALLYAALPAVGPAFADRELYEPLRSSRSFAIQNSLISVHNQIVAAPREFLVPAFMGIAAFPSLHVSHIYLPLLVAWKRARGLLVLFVPFFAAVALSTVYFGWHWAIDIPAGMATIHVCFWLARRLEPFEESARRRRAERAELRPETAEQVVRGLAQWPAVGALVGLHFIALLVSFVVLAPDASLSWGSGAALLFFAAFWVLLELCVATLCVAVLERWAEGSARRWLDVAKAAVLAGLWTLTLASTLKLLLTGSHLGGPELRFLLGNPGQLAGEASGLEVALALGLLLVFAAATALLYRGFAAARRRPAALPLRSFLLLGLLALLGTVYPIYGYPEARAMAPRIVPELGWIVGPPGTATLATAAEGELELQGERITPYVATSPPSAPNVLILMLESVSGNVLEAPAAAVAAPNLVELSEESTTFSRPYAPSVHSDYAQMSILSSLHPRKYDSHDYYERLDYPRTLVWDALAAAGWRTAAFSCQNERWGNMKAYLETPGLELLRHSPDWPEAPRKGRGTETKVFEPTVVGAWQEWLDGADERPWLAYLNFQATHFPYEIPATAERPFRPDEIDFPASFLHYPRDKIPVMRNRYLNALHYADRYLGEIVRVLRQRGEWDETVLVVVSDHGEAFYEHGQPTHGTQLFEEQVRSLLMVRFPGQAGRRVDAPVDLLDLAPSLVRRLGLPAHGNFQGRDDIFTPDYSAAGRSFYFTIQGMTSEDAILRDDWKYIVNWRTGEESLFHLATDPGELEDRLAERPDVARELAGSLSEFLGQQLAYYAQAGWEAGYYPNPLP